MELFGKVAPGFMRIRKNAQTKKEKEKAREDMVQKC